VGLIVCLRAVGWLLGAMLQGRPIPLSVLLQIPAAIFVGAYMGAVGGVVYAVFHPPLRRALRGWGSLLTGLLCAYGYMLAFGVPAALFSHDPETNGMVADPIFWGVATVFGLFVGGLLALLNRGA